MKVSQLKKLFKEATVDKVDDRESSAYKISIGDLNREFYVETDDKTEALAIALDCVINESDRIRGFELEL